MFIKIEKKIIKHTKRKDLLLKIVTKTMLAEAMILLVSITMAAPVVLDPEIYPNEIAVYFDREKWCFTVVGVVSAIEINEQISDGQKSITLYGDIKPQQDIHELMSEIVVNSTDFTTSKLERLENLASMVQRGWYDFEPSYKPGASKANFFIDAYPVLIALALIISYIAGVIFGLGLSIRVSSGMSTFRNNNKNKNEFMEAEETPQSALCQWGAIQKC